VDPRASLDDVEKKKFLTLLGLELRHLGRQLLYGLRYPGSLNWRVYSVDIGGVIKYLSPPEEEPLFP
jgi:hypothetical protein